MRFKQFIFQMCCQLIIGSIGIWISISHLGLDARKPVFGGLRKQRRRPACAYAQSDLRLYYSLIEKYDI